MPNYSFTCQDCRQTQVLYRPFTVGPVAGEACGCGGVLSHDFCDDVLSQEVNTAACKDHNYIPREKRVYRPGTRAQAEQREAAYARHVHDRRTLLREEGNRGTIRHTHSIPADLFHGKIRQTGDRRYWDDPANVAKHSEFKVG